MSLKKEVEQMLSGTTYTDDEKQAYRNGAEFAESLLKLDFEAAVSEVKAWYPEDIFIPGGQSLDAKSADMARKTCDNILFKFNELTQKELENGE